MPTNLPPEYFEVEKRYRAAETPAERADLLEELISTIPKHKGTDHLRADLRRRLAKLKAAAEGRKGTGKRTSSYHIPKEGAGQVVLLGPTNVGKSALVDILTNASPEVSEAPYTTWAPMPGMMPFENIQIQLIDTPPLSQEYVEPDLLNLVRRADLLLLVVDLLTHPIQHLEETVALLQERRIYPCHRRDHCEDQRRAAFVPALVVANKCDDEGSVELYEIFRELLEAEWPMVPVSAVTGRNLELLKRRIYDLLGIIRLYSRPPGQEPNYEAPFVMQAGGTVEEFARQVHLDFYQNLKSARVWGQGVFDGQMVGRDHVLHDGDVVELRI